MRKIKYYTMPIIIALTNIIYAPHSYGIDAFELMLKCEKGIPKSKSWKDLTEYSECVGYIIGSIETGENIYGLCIGGIRYGQITRVVYKYMQENPEKLNLPAHVVVISAMQKYFPCKK